MILPYMLLRENNIKGRLYKNDFCHRKDKKVALDVLVGFLNYFIQCLFYTIIFARSLEGC